MMAPRAPRPNSRRAMGGFPFGCLSYPNGHFPAEIALHFLPHAGRAHSAAEEAVELRQRGLDGHVVAADDARLRERGASCVLIEIHGSFEALRAVDDDYAARRR